MSMLCDTSPNWTTWPQTGCSPVTPKTTGSLSATGVQAFVFRSQFGFWKGKLPVHVT